METSLKELPAAQREVEVTLTLQEFALFEEKALAELRKDVMLEGFRKGNAPTDMVKNQVGKEELFAKTAQLAIQDAYPTALKEHNLEAVGQPEVRIVQAKEGQPLVFRILVEVLPDVTLPDYKKIASHVEKKPVEVKEEEVKTALDWLQQSKKKEDGTLPELTDEFAQSLGSFEGVDSLKQSIQSGLKMEKETHEKGRVRQEILDKVANDTSLELPQALVEREKEALFEQTKKGVKENLQIEFEEYLKKIQKSEQELKDSLAPQAEQRIKQFLVLHAIARQEEVSPSKEEVEAEMNKFLRQFPDPKEAQGRVDAQELYRYTEGVLQNEKTLQLLEDLVQKP